MAAQPSPRITPEQYLEIERAADTRHDYFEGQMFAIAGGLPQHATIILNLGSEMRAGLKGRPCTVMPRDVRTRVSPEGLYTYPDLVVVWGDMKFTDERRDTITNPVLVVEVLSKGTEAYDRGFKFAQYRTIETLQEYVLVWQAQARVEVFRRQANGQWLLSDFVGMDAVCQFESIDCRVAVAEIYDKVTLGEPDGRVAPSSPDSSA